MANIAQAIAGLKDKEFLDSFDPLRVGSRPTAQQSKIISAFLNREKKYIVVRAGNQSGKSATGMKAIAVMLREDPNDTWKRPKHWVGELLILCLAKQLKQAEESLLPKLTRHLKEGTYRIVKQGNALNKLVMNNGNTCLFFSHHNANQSRDAVQSFTAHAVMLDELPADPAIIEELDKRVLVNKGSILLTFTPKVPAPRVKNYLEALPEDRVLNIALSSLDNPSMDAETKEGMLSDAKARGEAFLNTILYGAWLQGERAVFLFNPETCLRPLPEHYSPQAWRHMLVVDPASASSTGCLVAGEDPQTGSWFVIHGSYILKGLDPYAQVKEAERRAAPYRITRRIYDSAATWFYDSAKTLGYSYMPVMNKANNKLEMIQGINSALGRSLFIVPEQAVDLEEELAGAQWSESAREHISHGHEYHLSDTLAYMLVSKPIFNGQTTDGQLDGWAQARLDERMTVISKVFKEDKVAAAGKKRIIQVRRTSSWR